MGRSKSASDRVLCQDDLRHGLKPHGKHPEFVEPSPPPSPTLSQSKNPSALLVIGQHLPSLLRDNLLGRMCSIHQAQGEQNTSVFTLASILNTFLLQHPTHHTLIVLTDFPWATMSLDAKNDFINLLVSTTGNVCTHHHTHPSFCPCKFVCLNLYRDRADFGDLVARDNLVWTREQFDMTLHLLGSMDNPEHSKKFAFPSLQPIYGWDSLEELFNSNNRLTSEFLRRIRNFIGDLVHRHFGNS